MSVDKLIAKLEVKLRRAEILSLSSDRLLKALITLMAIENIEILDNLEAIFAIAASQKSKIGTMPPEIWSEINREIIIIRKLVEGTDHIN